MVFSLILCNNKSIFLYYNNIDYKRDNIINVFLYMTLILLYINHYDFI